MGAPQDALLTLTRIDALLLQPSYEEQPRRLHVLLGAPLLERAHQLPNLGKMLEHVQPSFTPQTVAL